MRAAIYARYSSDLQREASIDDQIRECTNYVQREGWSISNTYADAALSGSSIALRPEFTRMMLDARADKFDVIVVIALGPSKQEFRRHS